MKEKKEENGGNHTDTAHRQSVGIRQTRRTLEVDRHHPPPPPPPPPDRLNERDSTVDKDKFRCFSNWNVDLSDHVFIGVIDTQWTTETQRSRLTQQGETTGDDRLRSDD